MDDIYDNENMRIIDEDGNEYRATDFGMNTKNKETIISKISLITS